MNRTSIEVKPLPWPPPGVALRKARARHAHRCLACGAEFRCSGPDETGLCAPVCPPCYWFELGLQLKVYSDVVAALNRRRAKIERKIGTAACRSALLRRRRLSRRQKLVGAYRDSRTENHKGSNGNGRPGVVSIDRAADTRWD